MRRYSIAIPLGLLSAFSGASLPSRAQTAVSITGTVTDPRGAALPNASVVLHDERNTVSRKTTADDRSPGGASTIGPTPFGGSINLLSEPARSRQDIRFGVSYGSFNTLLYDGNYTTGDFGPAQNEPLARCTPSFLRWIPDL